MSDRNDSHKNDQPEPKSEDLVAAPRDLQPRTDSDGLTRLIANDDRDNANRIATNEKDVKEKTEEKAVEAGVAEATNGAAEEWIKTPHAI